ncbi:riboflavin synthase, alpha subunit [Leptospira fainei serovar Hurstbridge str. BUT 6]|uniref:Riboflavin synthase n=1 Tax=Leptospira fainei serovar Hurstbridge str. BUT 6 TaxID=1193011 RepID=S3V056_9LEPT|nr:riboflavin synthase [Leptospira fainei]EPG74863.1 riboflavin synthase, alpha subunit [Leptospira fainei serovar Hurstbridge str. BUT 6]
MFTGLIETTGEVQSIRDTGEGKIFSLKVNWQDPDLKLGDSISVNGACHTVTSFQDQGNTFEFYSSYRTLELTNFGDFRNGTKVNLERSVQPHTRMGGHFVTGHVDAVGKITLAEDRDGGKVRRYLISHDPSLTKYFAVRGSITVDGISLTIVDSRPGELELVLIPETLTKTNAGVSWKIGASVNLEIDLVARYLEQLLKSEQK